MVLIVHSKSPGVFPHPWGRLKVHYHVSLADGRELGIFRNYKTGIWYKVVD